MSLVFSLHAVLFGKVCHSSAFQTILRRSVYDINYSCSILANLNNTIQWHRNYVLKISWYFFIKTLHDLKGFNHEYKVDINENIPAAVFDACINLFLVCVTVKQIVGKIMYGVHSKV